MPDVWGTIMGTARGDAYYMPLVRWENRLVDLDARNALAPCPPGAATATISVPVISQQGRGSGYLYLDGDYFGCTDEPVCDFYYAGKKYDLRNRSVVDKLRCSRLPYVKNQPARPLMGWAQGSSRIVPVVTLDYKRKSALCLPIPKKSGEYRIFFNAQRTGVPGRDVYAYKCTYSDFTNSWTCGWRLDGSVGGSRGRKFKFDRVMVVTPVGVSLEKRAG